MVDPQPCLILFIRQVKSFIISAGILMLLLSVVKAVTSKFTEDEVTLFCVSSTPNWSSYHFHCPLNTYTLTASIAQWNLSLPSWPGWFTSAMLHNNHMVDYMLIPHYITDQNQALPEQWSTGCPDPWKVNQLEEHHSCPLKSAHCWLVIKHYCYLFWSAQPYPIFIKLIWQIRSFFVTASILSLLHNCEGRPVTFGQQ